MVSVSSASSFQHRLDAAVGLHRNGDVADAVSWYRALLCEAPGNHDLLHLLGLGLHQIGRTDAAVSLIRRALRAAPCPAYAVSLGSVLNDQKRFADAEPLLADAVAADPAAAEGHFHHGTALSGLGRVDAASHAYRRALALAPALTLALVNLGTIRERQGQPAAAELCYRRAIQVMPSSAVAHYNLATVLHAQDRLEAAEAAYRTAARLNPDHAPTRYNLGLLYHDLGRLGAAERAYRAAIRQQPAHADSHWNLSLVLLSQGRFAEGWEEYEWRWRTRDFQNGHTRYPFPPWRGEALAGSRILIHTEQGVGDTIQFIRYVPLLVQAGARVLLSLPRPLDRLTASLGGGVQRLFEGDEVPPVDFQCPLLSLPRLFGTRIGSIPADVPYLTADPALAAAWAQRLGPRRAPLRVGIVWAGNPTYRKDRPRSPGLAAFAPLFAVDGVEFVILQQGQGRDDLRTDAPLLPRLVDPGALAPNAPITDFMDTAAIMDGVDLVVSSCTAPAHLAGALGRPVWVALQAVPDWRWGMAGEATPWYPTMRLFRQTARGDWNGVFTRMAGELADMARIAASAPEHPPRKDG